MGNSQHIRDLPVLLHNENNQFIDGFEVLKPENDDMLDNPNKNYETFKAYIKHLNYLFTINQAIL
jgi:hypothetical protein